MLQQVLVLCYTGCYRILWFSASTMATAAATTIATSCDRPITTVAATTATNNTDKSSFSHCGHERVCPGCPNRFHMYEVLDASAVLVLLRRQALVEIAAVVCPNWFASEGNLGFQASVEWDGIGLRTICHIPQNGGRVPGGFGISSLPYRCSAWSFAPHWRLWRRSDPAISGAGLILRMHCEAIAGRRASDVSYNRWHVAGCHAVFESV